MSAEPDRPPPQPRRSPVAHEAALLGTALQFLTRLPLRLHDFRPGDLNASVRYFAPVGTAVGALAAGVLWAACALWPLPLPVLLSLAATVCATGALHEDGLADTCDGLGGGATRDEALRIMKDSRLGTCGVLGLLLVLALKAAALVALASHAPAWALGALLWAHTLSRGAAVVVMSVLPYAGDAAASKQPPLAQPPGRAGGFVAAAWSLALAVPLHALVPAPALAASAAGAGLAALVVARTLRRRLDGYTGDTLGAVQQLSEVAVYLVLAALAGAAGG